MAVPMAAPTGAASTQPVAKDGHLWRNRDLVELRTARYSFRESFPYALTPDSIRYGTLEQFRDLYPDSYWKERIANLTNEDGSLAWDVTQDIMALITLYDLTGDPSFLRWPREYAVAVMAVRDDHSGKKDADGRSSPGWGTTRYGDQTRRIYLVHSGLIVRPILEWALRAPQVPGWSEEAEKQRQALVDQCLETILWHDYQLAPDPNPDESVYKSGREEEDRKYTWQPYNRQNLFARNFYLLYKLRDDESFLERSRKLYTFFRNRLEVTPSNAYVWEYEPIRGAGRIQVASCDDVSHATYSLMAIYPACQDGFVFDSDDLARFARTFTLYVHLGDGVFQSKVGCQPTFSPRYMKRLYGWLPLSQADPSIYWLLRRFLMYNFEKPEPLALAYLIAYKPKWSQGIDTRVR